MSDVWYVCPGTKSGYYHYAQCLLSEIQTEALCLYVGPEGDHFSTTEKPLIVMTDSKIEAVTKSVIAVIGFLKSLLLNPPQTVHVNSVVYSEPLTMLVLLAARIRGVHTVWTLHEVPGDRYGSGPSPFWSASLRIAHDIIVHHEQMVARIGRPAHVIPHGNYTIFDNMADATETAEVTVLFPGDREYKGVDFFLDALSYVESDPDYVLLGDLEHPDIRSVDGFLSDEELARHYKNADIVVLPYRGGQTSGALHIALATGNSVVVPDRSMFTDVLSDDYPTVVLDPKDIAAEIDRQTRDDGYRRKLTLSGREIAESTQYDWSSIANRTEEIYEAR